MLRHRILTLLATLGIVALAGCSKSGNPMAPTPVGFGSVTMRLTDAPATFDHIDLDVREVWVHRVDDGTPGDTLWSRDDTHPEEGDTTHDAPDSLADHPDSTGDHERDEDGMWHRLDVTPAIVDLLDLRNGVFHTLAAGRVPAGVYNQVRLVLGPNNSIVVDGVEHPLIVPSGQQSGYKLFGRFAVPVDGDVDVGVDIDGAHSVHETGNGMWILMPVARIEPIVTTGRIHGEIDPATATSWVYAMQGADTVATTESAGDGSFTLALLPPGDYGVHIVPTVEGFHDTTIAPVHVVAGQTTELGTIHLEGSAVLPGRLVGQVYPSTFTTRAYLLQSGSAKDTTDTAADGRFQFEDLAAGSYDVHLVPMDAGYRDTTLTGLAVTAGATTDVGVVALPAAGPAAQLTSGGAPIGALSPPRR